MVVPAANFERFKHAWLKSAARLIHLLLVHHDGALDAVTYILCNAAVVLDIVVLDLEAREFPSDCTLKWS